MGRWGNPHICNRFLLQYIDAWYLRSRQCSLQSWDCLNNTFTWHLCTLLQLTTTPFQAGSSSDPSWQQSWLAMVRVVFLVVSGNRDDILPYLVHPSHPPHGGHHFDSPFRQSSHPSCHPLGPHIVTCRHTWSTLLPAPAPKLREMMVQLRTHMCDKPNVFAIIFIVALPHPCTNSVPSM